MQVKQRLKINVIVSVMTAAALFLVLSVALYRVNHAMETSDITDELVESAFERSIFRADYLRSNSERARIQWFAKYEQIGRLLNAASEKFSDAEDRKTVDALIKDHRATGKIFSAIVENRGRSGLNADSAVLAQEIENRLITQLNMRLYENILSIRKLHESARGSLSSALRLAGWGTFAAFVIVIAVTFINSWTMRRIITDRILRLRNGASVIGDGNLDHRIDIKGDDEFSELSGAFNAMTAKLCIYRDNIGEEMKERQQAEDLLRCRSEELETIIRELALSEDRYHSLFENMMHGFAYCRMLYGEGGKPVNFIYLDVNTAFGKLTGLENVIGRRVSDVIPGIREAHPELFDIYGRVALTGQPEGFEIEFKPLKIWLSISVYSPAREHFVAIFDNITERKRAEEALLESAEDLAVQNVKLEDVNKELEAFIYSVAHDLRAPLRHMSSFARFLKEDYTALLDEQGKDYLMRITRGSEKMSRLIEDLLDLSRISKQQMRLMEIDLSKLAGDIIAGLREANPERRVETFIEEGLKSFVDKPLMDIVLSNLIENAWKFTSKTENARIEFGVRGLSLFTDEAESVRLDSERSRRIGAVPASPVTTTIYYVRDNGVGFNHEYVEKMFGPFQRLHSENEFPGTGIGLAIVERIIRRHGGNIWAEGEVNKGAVIYFTVG